MDTSPWCSSTVGKCALAVEVLSSGDGWPRDASSADGRTNVKKEGMMRHVSCMLEGGMIVFGVLSEHTSTSSRLVSGKTVQLGLMSASDTGRGAADG